MRTFCMMSCIYCHLLATHCSPPDSPPGPVEAPPPEPEPRPCSPSTVHHHREAMRNCALSLDQIQEYHSPSRLAGETPRSPAYAAVTRHRTHSGGRVLAVVPPSPVLRRSSDPQLSPSADGGGPPPKPPAKGYVDRLQLEEGGGATEEGGGATEGGGARQGEGGFSAPQVETTSSFRPYESSLLPPENKPLEMSVLKRVKELLAEVARILGVSCDMQRMMGVASGLELLTLPHGHQFYTMSIMVAVDLLGCTGTTEERAALLHKTILLAAELKTCLGNMFGFAAVMRALDLPQISRLEQTWVTLRQRHTEGAILYEKKLKPFMKNMNDCQENSVLSNTAFPHVVPVLSLLERCVPPGEAGGEPWESVEAGVDVVMCHLEAARLIAHHGALQSERYQKFDKVLTALSHKLEPLVRQSEL
ncbi:hypothetical protein NHX12_027025 [Muraenolepis orangiensis]|uniref:Ras-GEF domain-containing protein n=1 Tax=Muraenolepis orangiensis TaxID=630683 RepID=A0A9Q0INF0_9TELE|nr:hypothetical protein NHX12_027025 [Muraenolepis orangiensis]